METKTIKAYKGFDKDMTCRGYQYEVGKEYEHDGDVRVCHAGFHACENPFDVLNYYGSILDHRYCIVEQSGDIKSDGDKKASSKIKITAEIGFQGLFKAGIEWLAEVIKPVESEPSPGMKNDNGDDHAQIGSSGDHAQIGSSGDRTQIGSLGDSVHIASSGDWVRIGSSGDWARIGSSGDWAQIGSSGNRAQIGSSGNRAQIGSSGDLAQIGSSGNSAKIGSSGSWVQIGSSGNSAQIGSSGRFAQIGSLGDSAQIGSSGDYAQIGSSGTMAKIGSSGDGARVNSTGEDCVICCAGCESIVRAKIGSWITLAEWGISEEKGRLVPKCVKTEYVDGERIKPDTWYRLLNGEFTECVDNP